MNLFLIGYRCTGKTSVGRFLAGVLGWGFIDADSELVKEHDMTIREIVARWGWNDFREKERIIIKKLCTLDRYVVATGGGAVLNDENVEGMKKRGDRMAESNSCYHKGTYPAGQEYGRGATRSNRQGISGRN